jgi:hypothetical protein
MAVTRPPDRSKATRTGAQMEKVGLQKLQRPFEDCLALGDGEERHRAIIHLGSSADDGCPEDR